MIHSSTGVRLLIGDIDLGEVSGLEIEEPPKCPGCGERFAPSRRGHRFCSAACLSRHCRRRQKAGLPAKLFGVPVVVCL